MKLFNIIYNFIKIYNNLKCLKSTNLILLNIYQNNEIYF